MIFSISFNFKPNVLRSFNCVLCGHLSEGLDKYVLHLVSHDLLFNGNNNGNGNHNNGNNNNFSSSNSIVLGNVLVNNNFNLTSNFTKKDANATTGRLDQNRLDLSRLDPNRLDPSRLDQNRLDPKVPIIRLPTGTTCTVSSDSTKTFPMSSSSISPNHNSENSLDELLLNFTDFIPQESKRKSPLQSNVEQSGNRSIQVPLPFLGLTMHATSPPIQDESKTNNFHRFSLFYCSLLPSMSFIVINII